MAASQKPDISAEHLELLAEVSRLLSGLNLGEVMGEVVQLATYVTTASRAMLLIRGVVPGEGIFVGVHESGESFSMIEHDAAEGELRHDIRLAVARDIMSRGLMGWSMHHGETALVSDTSSDPRWHEFEDNFYGARSAIAVPLMLREDVFGALSVSHPDVDHFNPSHVRLLSVIANQAAVAIQHAEMVNALHTEKERFKAIIAAAPDILLVLSAAGVILTASDPIVMLLDGYTRKAILGKTVANLVEIDSVFAPLEKVVRGNLNKSDDSAPAYGEWSFETQSEKRGRDYLVNIAVWESDVNGESGYVVMMKDVTAMRTLGRFKDEMLRAVSHDLRTPVVLIVGYADLLREDVSVYKSSLPDAETYIRGIMEGAERIEQMLDTIMRAEKVRSSPLELLEEVHLNNLARQVVDRMAVLAERKGMQLQVTLTTQEIPNIVGDSVLLGQAMENLIGNAIKYTPEGGTISVETEVRGSRFYYIVQDTGVGISQNDLKRVFQSFFRAKKTEDTTQGSGVGLSLVKNIIEQHGGEIDVESMINKGSTFAFWLPLFKN